MIKLILLTLISLSSYAQTTGPISLEECLQKSLPLPNYLTNTCLYEDNKKLVVSKKLQLHKPRFPLYTDTAIKTRWVYLPNDSKIDNSDLNSWNFPKGTIIWKQFVVDGKKIETRMLKKIKDEKGPESWVWTTYKWNIEQTDAVKFDKGEDNVMGTGHDIPSKYMCYFCHRGRKDLVLGLGQVQLSHKGDQNILSLKKLQYKNQFTKETPEFYHIPGNKIERKALGYLHANCSHCHNPQHNMGNRVGMFFKIDVNQKELEKQPVYQTAINKKTIFFRKGMNRIKSGDAKNSAVIIRMSSSVFGVRMAPFGRETLDKEAIQDITAWINLL